MLTHSNAEKDTKIMMILTRDLSTCGAPDCFLFPAPSGTAAITDSTVPLLLHVHNKKRPGGLTFLVPASSCGDVVTCSWKLAIRNGRCKRCAGSASQELGNQIFMFSCSRRQPGGECQRGAAKRPLVARMQAPFVAAF